MDDAISSYRAASEANDIDGIMATLAVGECALQAVQTTERDNPDVSYSLLRSAEAFWRPSNQMKVENTDLGKQLGASKLGARLWRLGPGQASTKHRHLGQEELYVLLEGEGRVRVDDELLTLAPLDTLLVSADSTRQLFNDTRAAQLWLVVGAPPELANTLEMTAEQLARLYPDDPRALPPELGGGTFSG